jgi:hypothetical protein
VGIVLLPAEEMPYTVLKEQLISDLNWMLTNFSTLNFFRALVVGLAVVVVQVALAVVAAMAVVRPLPQWSELPQVRM